MDRRFISTERRLVSSTLKAEQSPDRRHCLSPNSSTSITASSVSSLTEYFSKPVALYSRTHGSGAFQAMMNKIRNAIDWALSSNRDWIVKDLQVLEGKVGELEPLEPVTTDTVAASGSTSTQS
jgi:hypothetical protein